VDKASGNKEEITITNEKGRLSEEDIERMVKEAEEFAEEDKMQKEKTEAKNVLENYLYHLKTQVTDEKQLGGKLADDDKKTILSTIKEKMDWMDEHSASATKEDFDEQKAEVEAIVNPITSKMYGKDGEGRSAGDATQPEPDSHDEL